MTSEQPSEPHSASVAAEQADDTSESWWHRSPIARRWREFRLEVDTETAFPETRDELRARLATDDAELAQEILNEAEASYDRMQERIDGAERRATTLQGAAAIAASLTLTGATLLADRTKLLGLGWRVAFGLVLVYITGALVLCAYRATLASSRVHRWVMPSDRGVLARAGGTVVSARTERAVELLLAVGGNQRIARWKVAMMRAAAEWLTRALAALLVLALLATAYALFGPDPKQGPPPAAPTTPAP